MLLEDAVITTIHDSARFLKRFKEEAGASGIQFVPRKANLDTLAYLGISIGDAENVIFSLSAKDYESGPASDHDGSSGEVWVFGTSVDATNIYIKIKLDVGRAACISFHQAQYPLRFPLR